VAWKSSTSYGKVDGKKQLLKVPERIRPMSSEAAAIEELGKRWVEAELAQDLAIMDALVGVHDQEAAYRGQSSNGQFRATHILVRDDGAWRLIGMHLSPIAAPPTMPQQTS
jgi:SnoaL-like domain